ncbi:HlyD family efflux transporter periplasmic adaptor subunit [Rhizobium lentis]|uniref:Putative peptide zinc metalloprotease protein n=1 Tax=Rhizobium lentis TaxID=1138194 RepID=A0A7W8XET1_9HYPH|nr:efflux RND transporter periplasmic adaptor subunit [Rhizobium lentis]MBB4574632.1 putative peptide zinc metalloprotease protein [Rhizobium lentis]MBB5550559.1 putative peptide zinc metalloprotease protein [Rhizobium lentis]MBB5561319.1 putative peptide zinc metalloprotease protein [Rhizobium lentis]MBB5567678.1 putative peptide zinc metalloprotease protein [Rhizobium lentis]
MRDELVLERAGRLRGGAPSWTLYDPAANRFYRIGWLEFEVLCRWRLGDMQEIADQIGRDTTLRPEKTDIEQFFRFLSNAHLLREARPEATRRLLERKAAGQHGWLTWLIHHYLFIRIPLLRPDRILGILLRRLEWVYSYGFLTTTVLVGLTGLYLALRQWDTFKVSFPWFFSLEGAALAGAALLFSKVLHELGHGLTAKRYGCRVPSMGVALLVMAPVLYTDTSAAWRLKDRRKRLAIGCAGVAAECCLAAYALLLWSFLPDGAFRSVVLVWATTAWVLTVFINMSPFMRFDGYYLFSDLIDVPNLQERSFALARHKLREMLFDFRAPPPEPWSRGMRRILLVYAFSTWLYRFFLFLGIALVVYHMFFKALGILLFAVELWWFTARPIVRELIDWGKRRRSRPLNARTVLTFTIFAGILVTLVVPWRGSVHAPALLAAATQVELFTQVAGRVSVIHVKVGDRVERDEPLIEFASPEIEFKFKKARLHVDDLVMRIRAAAQDPTLRSDAQLLERELEGAKAELAAAEVERGRLVIRAQVSGTVVQLADPLAVGEWLKVGESVGLIADAKAARVRAYVMEADLQRIEVGGEGSFVPADLASPRLKARVITIDGAAIETLPDGELASLHGGAIATRQGANATLVPEVSLYRVTLEVAEPSSLQHLMSGIAVIEARPASIAGQIWRKVAGVIIRESGI